MSALEYLIEAALKQGATEADAIQVRGESSSVACRLGKLESTEHASDEDIGLRVLVGKRQAIVSGNETSAAALDELVARAIVMAKATPENPYAGLAEANQIAQSYEDLDSFDGTLLSTDQLRDMAMEAESAALDVKGITNSEGAESSFGSYKYDVLASNGFSGSYRQSSFGTSAMVLAEADDGTMESDYDYDSKVFLSDLKSPAAIGKEAGERTLKLLKPRKVKTGKYPVIFDPRQSRSLLGDFLSAINGASIARGTSFLRDKMGEAVFSDAITIVDNPLKKRGLSSKPFDIEGIKTAPVTLVENGVLKSWILDLQTARQLGLETNGHASRGVGSSPMPRATNVILQPGTTSVEDMIGDIEAGYYVTSTMGFGVNMVTGEYSQGSSGFWIENGKLTYPVNEVTIAGDLTSMFMNMVPANDLDDKGSKLAPTLFMGNMTVAGE